MLEHVGVNTKDPVMTVKVTGDVFPRVSYLADGSLLTGLGVAVPTQATALVIPLVTAPLTLTNQLLADGFIAGDNSYRYKADLATFTQVRLTGVVQTVGTATGKIQLRYQAADSTTVASLLIMGATSVEISEAATGLIDSGWINLVTGAKISPCFLGLMSIGGDGVADPVVNNIRAEFR